MGVAFYAPMKSPRHDTPSGDRRMAQLLMQALTLAGHAVELASEFRSYDGQGDPARQERLRDQGSQTAEALLAAFAGRPAGDRPTAWFTYHLYHKAPDWLGPAVSRALEIPYVIAEASYAPKRAGGPWSLGHGAAATAIAAADHVLCLTREFEFHIAREDFGRDLLCVFDRFAECLASEVRR